ncbi:MAG: hypothetical protein QNK37_19820 [Acidobacteriota bacterium]|nr:hypothetical protein [Acidobacteriota bacterium]
MSWNTSVLALNTTRHAQELLAELGFPNTDLETEVDFQEAGSRTLSGMAVGRFDDWILIWDAHFFLGDTQIPPAHGLWSEQLEERLRRLSRDLPVFGAVLSGAGGTYGFAYYEHGARVRAHLAVDDEVLLDEGTPLPAEQTLSEEDEEQRICALLAALSVPWSVIEAGRYRLYG